MTQKIFAGILAAMLLAGTSLAALTVSFDTASIDFGSVAPGEWKEAPLARDHDTLVVVSDTGNVWTAKISVTQALTNGTFPSITIPNENFRWMSTYAGNKNAPYTSLVSGLNHPAGLGYVNFSAIDELVYTSGKEAAYIDNNNSPAGTEIQFKWGMAMPSNQRAGTYATTVRYTVTQ
ncbi:MAG: hypothetical protein AABZ57_01475 [Candidatus Margulisiibacteriota bacterium]